MSLAALISQQMEQVAMLTQVCAATMQTLSAMLQEIEKQAAPAPSISSPPLTPTSPHSEPDLKPCAHPVELRTSAGAMNNPGRFVCRLCLQTVTPEA